MSNLVLPSEIPWRELRAKELEECVYWLADSMGAKDLEWRVGGTGAGAADQGRDLECVFYVADPAGGIFPEKWWIEVKGRNKTVEPKAVRDAVLGASAGAPDVLVVATNTRFSNPTRDWITSWRTSHPRPKVFLWDRSDLEKLASRHPEAIVRMFAGALSPQGKLEVARSRFWNGSGYSDNPTLQLLWEQRADLEWNDQSIIAAIVSEFANGDIEQRPWSLQLSGDELMSAVASALANTLHFCLRADKVGIEQRPYIEGVSYLTLSALQRVEPDDVGRLFEDVWGGGVNVDLPTDARTTVLSPVVGHLVAQVRDVCTDDCSRVSADLTTLREEDCATYWDRLKQPADQTPRERESVFVTVEKEKEPCKVGFEVGPEDGCPILRLSRLNHPEEDLEAAFSTLAQIVRERTGEPVG